jgi:methyl-accepting chemotaxis protein
VKISTLSWSTHALASLSGAAAMLVAQRDLSIYPILVLPLAVAAVLLLSRLLTRRILICLHGFEQAIATGKEHDLRPVQIREFDQASERLRELVQRWSLAASRSREQTRGIELLVRQIDRRSEDRAGETNLGDRLRQILTGLTREADRNLNQIQEGIGQLQRAVRDLSTATDDQNNAVGKAASYVEQLSNHIAIITESAGLAEVDVRNINETTGQVRDDLRGLASRIRGIQNALESSESRLRSLSDHFREITAVTETMGEIAARTDMLALNVSIESVRSGHQGRGYSSVAEEVRKLAEHASQAAREVTGLVESMQLETQESISAISQQRTDLIDQLERLETSHRTVQQTYEASDKTGIQLNEISRAANQQVQVIQDLVSPVETITKATRTNRGQAEATIWTLRSLEKVMEQFDALLEFLRSALGLSQQAIPRPQRVETDQPAMEHADDIEAVCAR